jgi:ABC-type nitrate/sulfonate/bicarbonate transport system ATPase subunit
MIELDRVTFGYKSQTQIFKEFSWSVARGESWAVLGTSGCGKTTLFYLLAGLREVTSGLIRINDEVLKKPRPKTGLILQDFGLLPWATVKENITLGLRIRHFYGPDGKHVPYDEKLGKIGQSADYWMEKLGLSKISHQYPQQLSGGQRQRTAIARTLSLKPDLLLMDEPFASLDAPTRENLQQFIIELRHEKQITNLLVTHSIEEAALMGEKILVLKGIPNKAPVIIENTQGGSSDSLHNESFTHICQILRKEIEAS